MLPNFLPQTHEKLPAGEKAVVLPTGAVDGLCAAVEVNDIG